MATMVFSVVWHVVGSKFGAATAAAADADDDDTDDSVLNCKHITCICVACRLCNIFTQQFLARSTKYNSSNNTNNYSNSSIIKPQTRAAILGKQQMKIKAFSLKQGEK